MFGGSGETAYILVYRNVELNASLSIPHAPEYWVDFIANQNAQLEQERALHADMKQRIDVILQPSDMFELQDDFLMYKPDSAATGQTVNARLTDPVSLLQETVRERFGEAHVYEVCSSLTSFLSIQRSLDELDAASTLKDAGVSHLSTWLVVLKEIATLDAALSWMGRDCEPIELQVKVLDEIVSLPVMKAWPLLRLQEILFERTGIDPSSQRIQASIGGSVQELNSTDRTKSFSELKIAHKAKFTVTIKESPLPLSATAVIVESEQRNPDDVSILIYDEHDPEKIIKHCERLCRR